jgi:AcrR family transcriptional regulator
LPRQADPQLEKRILDAACRLWARGGEKFLTMRGVAQAAVTTTPTLYERYRDRDALLRAVRTRTRAELFAALSQTHTLSEACERHLEFAMQHSHAYEVLFDGIGQPPSLHEPWPSFNLFRHRLAKRLGGTPRQHTRLMLSLWSLMHGTAMLLIRGRFTEPVRAQMFHACLDAAQTIVEQAAHRNGKAGSGPKWPSGLLLGEGPKSTAAEGKPAPKGRSKSKSVSANRNASSEK